MSTVRFDKWGKLTCIAEAQGYVMVRRPNAVPRVMSMKDWCALSTEPQALNLPRVRGHDETKESTPCK